MKNVAKNYNKWMPTNILVEGIDEDARYQLNFKGKIIFGIIGFLFLLLFIIEMVM